jgi:hypothetical protein
MIHPSSFYLLVLLVVIQQRASLAWSSQKNGSTNRRNFLIKQVTNAAGILVVGPDVASATRAVGGAEEDCRAAGNCLEKFELDGAVGWSWGASKFQS